MKIPSSCSTDVDMDGQLQKTGATVAFDICGWPGTISSKIMRTAGRLCPCPCSLRISILRDTHPPQISTLLCAAPPLQYSDLRTEGLGLLGFSAISLPQGWSGPSTDQHDTQDWLPLPGFLSLIGWYLPRLENCCFIYFAWFSWLFQTGGWFPGPAIPTLSARRRSASSSHLRFPQEAYLNAVLDYCYSVFSRLGAAAVHAQLCPTLWL